LCLAEAAEFFFVTADGGRNGVQCATEVGDLGGEPGQGVGFPTVGAVFFDDSAPPRVAVEGGSPQSGASGDVIEGDEWSGENDCSASLFDVWRRCSGVIRSVPD
jgi:hypothetical protein